MADALEFSFDFAGQPRADLLREAEHTLLALNDELAPDETRGAAPADAPTLAAQALLKQMGSAVAEIAAHPDLLPLEAAHFAAHGMAVPARFVDLAATHNFYWLRIPLTLMPAPNMPFVRLDCAAEFNPGDPPALRPRAQAIFPDRRFETVMKTHTRLDFELGEDLGLAVAASLPGPGDAALLKAGVDAKLDAGLGIKVGPFEHVWKRALVEHTAPGSEKVFWRVQDAEFFRDDAVSFIVVLQVPRAAPTLRVAVAIQAAAEFSAATATLGQFLKSLSGAVTRFLRGGAPVQDTRVWDLSAQLGQP